MVVVVVVVVDDADALFFETNGNFAGIAPKFMFVLL